MFLNKWKKKKRIELVRLIDNGFEVIYDETATLFSWIEIDKLIGFKIDRFTTDDICLKIESGNKFAIISEEFDGWRIFMNELLNRFPTIDKNWEGIISYPAFERNETELYNRMTN